jgi:hypothetical protein
MARAFTCEISIDEYRSMWPPALMELSDWLRSRLALTREAGSWCRSVYQPEARL